MRVQFRNISGSREYAMVESGLSSVEDGGVYVEVTPVGPDGTVVALLFSRAEIAAMWRRVEPGEGA